MKKKKTIAVSLQIETVEKLKKAAADQNRTVSNSVEYVLQKELKREAER